MIYILNQDLNVLGVANNKGNALPYYDDLHIENIESGAETYEFTVPGDHPTTEHLQAGNLVVINNLDGEKVMFTVISVEDTHDDYLQRKVYCEQAGMQLLNEIETPYKASSQNKLDHYAERALTGTSWSLGKNEATSNLTLNFEENESVLARLHKIASEFDVELHFTVEMNGARVTGKHVNFLKQRGSDSGKRFTYTKDIKSIIRKVEAYNVITAVRGVGRTDDKGVTTTFKDKVYDDGDFYSEAGSYLIHSRSALARWGRQGGNIFGLFEFDTDNVQNLWTRTLNHLKDNIEPQVTYEVDVALLERLAEYDEEKVRIGDTVKVQDTGFSPALYLEARVIQLETSYTNPDQDKATLGNYKLLSSTINDAIRALQSKLLQKESTWDQMGEVILKEPTPPPTPTEGQLWLDTGREPSQLMVYRSGEWKPASPDSTYIELVVGPVEDKVDDVIDRVDVVEQEVVAIEVKANTAQMTAEEAQANADQAIAGAQNALDAAQEADANAQAAQQRADEAYSSAQSKEAAIHKGTTAPTSPATGKLWLDTSTTPNSFKRWSGSAWVKVTPTVAGDLNAYTVTEVDNALNAKVSTTTYTTDKNGIITRLDSAESSITQNANAIASKVAQSDFNTLTGRVESAETNITQNATDISLKAEKIVVDGISTRLESAEAKITPEAITSTVRGSTQYAADLAAKEGSIIKANTAPAHANGKLWLDTSKTPNVLMRSTGSAWVKASPTTASDVGAYSSTDGSNLASRVTTAEEKITAEAITNTVRTSSLYADDQERLKEYIQSRGQNLVTNGTGLLGDNTNFSYANFDKSDAYASNGSFTFTGEWDGPETDELIPVNPDKSYRFKYYTKANPMVGTPRIYGYVSSYDADGNAIAPRHTMYRPNTLTTLAATLSPGATTVRLTSSANWLNTGDANNSYERAFIFWNYVNAGGYQWPENTYSRNYYSDMWNAGGINTSTHTITLKTPWAGPTIPSGTKVSNGTSGGALKYIAGANSPVTATWQPFEGVISGIDTSGQNNTNKFHPGTASIKLGWLCNITGVGSKTWLSNISFEIDYGGQIAGLGTRLTEAEQKITDSSIVNTVTSSTVYQSNLATKAGKEEVDTLQNYILDKKTKGGNVSVFGATDFGVIASEARSLGLNTLTFPIRINAVSATDSSPTLDAGDWTKIQGFIQEAKAANFKVIIEPYPYVGNGTIVETNWNPSNKATWFTAWGNHLNTIATFAEANGVESMYIASNLVHMEPEVARWTTLINTLRTKFSGELIYRTNWWITASWAPETITAYNAKLNNAVFGLVDVIAIAAYFELTDVAQPTKDQLKAALFNVPLFGRGQNIHDEVKAFHDKWGKPVMFGELGIPPWEGFAAKPWSYDKGSAAVWEPIQANWFDAFHEVFGPYSWFKGYSIYAIGQSDSVYSIRDVARQSILSHSTGSLSGDVNTLKGRLSGAENTLSGLDIRVQEAEQKITADAITSSVLDSQSFLDVLGAKVDAETLAEYATSDALGQMEIVLKAYADGKISDIDFSPYVTSTQLTQTKNEFDFLIKSGGGVNLIKNSVGWAEDADWALTGSGTWAVLKDDAELDSVGSGAAWMLNARTITQEVPVRAGNDYTFSCMAWKTATKAGMYLEYDDGSGSFKSGPTIASASAYNWEPFSYTFKAVGDTVKIRLRGAGASSDLKVANVMLNIGTMPMQWTHSAGEMYNTNIKFNQNGIIVKNNATNGETRITPTEFSGWARDEDGNQERIFTLNGDTTEVKKLQAEEQFAMGTMRILYIQSTNATGWSFLPRQMDS